LQLRVEEAPERPRAADEVLPRAALRLVEAERDAGPERRPRERRVDVVLVDAVAELVHRAEQPVHPGLPACREPDVHVAGRRHERVSGLVEPPRLVVEAELLEHGAREALLPGTRELDRRGGIGYARLADERQQLALELVEDGANLRRLHPLLVVVEPRVLGLLPPPEALDGTGLERELGL